MAGVLLPVGVYCTTIAAKRDRAALPLAVIPILFSLQQLAEGLVWVGIGQHSVMGTQAAAYVYLFFALVFWLGWIPLSALWLEPRRVIKLVLAVAAVAGLAGGLAFYLPLVLDPATLVVSVDRHSLRYDIGESPALLLAPQAVWHGCYLALVSLPLMLVARHRRGLLGFGILLIVSSVLSHAYFWYAFASIWCLFAALLSLSLAYVFHRLPLPERTISLGIDGPIASPSKFV